MATVAHHHQILVVRKARLVARGLLHLLPIALALAIVTWWPRPVANRPVVAPVPTPGASASTLALTSPGAPAPAPVPDPADDAEDLRLSEAIERAQASTVALEYDAGDPSGKRRVATGVVFSDEGDVISVRVEPREGPGRDSIVARDLAGHEHPARWMAADPETGLTLLRVSAPDVRPIRPSARAAILGAAVFLIGHPYDLGQSVSRGNVAGLNRRVKYGPRPLGSLIQLQVALHPGDSGALLADMRGGWLGLVRGDLVTPDARDDHTLGFAIPAPDVLWVANQLLAHRKVDRAYLGIKFSHETSSATGARVASVVEKSPAEKAGLRPGDRITRVADRPVRTPDDLIDQLDRTAAGLEVALEYARGTVVTRLSVRTAPRPPRPAEPPSTPAPPAVKPVEPPKAEDDADAP